MLKHLAACFLFSGRAGGAGSRWGGRARQPGGRAAAEEEHRRSERLKTKASAPKENEKEKEKATKRPFGKQPGGVQLNLVASQIY